MTYRYAHPHPAVTVDVAVFARRDDGLSLLLVQRAREPYAGRWALPGGFVGIDESLEAAAHRELREETGIVGIELAQLYTFGDPDRDPRERVISVAYVGILQAPPPAPRAASDAAEARWFDADGLPVLAFDHAEIVALARSRLVPEPHRG